MPDHPCAHANCTEPAIAQCENCDTWFCEDHGTKGRDHERPGYATVSWPGMCWKCGGKNNDE
jgi:hypothetical protein